MNQFFGTKSKDASLILFFMLPLLALITRPYGATRSIGLIVAVKQKLHKFWWSTLKLWLLISAISGFFLVLITIFVFKILGDQKYLTGSFNVLFLTCFFFLLFNVIPTRDTSCDDPGQSFSVAIWGPRQSGKTVYIGMLSKSLADNWAVMPSPAASEYIIDILDQLDREEWPAPTPPPQEGRDPELLMFDFAGRHMTTLYTGRRTFSLYFFDPSGEIFDSTGQGANKAHFDREIANLVCSSGVLLLMDHALSQDQNGFHEILERNLNTFKERITYPLKRNKIPIPFAICLTKCDELYGKYEKYLKKPKALFRRLFGEVTYQLLARTIYEFEFFLVSSIGVKKHENRRVPRTHEHHGRIVPDRELEPTGLFKPLEWLFNRAH